MPFGIPFLLYDFVILSDSEESANYACAARQMLRTSA
jgi:hypothetical protein